MGENKVLATNGLKNELIMIEYPGLVKNDEKMIKTLGGLGNISQTINNPKKRLELKFHPNNFFNKSTNGDMTETCGLLIKVKIKRPKNLESDTENLKHSMEIIGQCKNVIRFDSLCDYQFLPIDINKDTGQATNIYGNLLPNGIMDQEYFKNQQIPFFSLPQLFSRSDTVFYKLHRSGEQQIDQNEHLGAVKTKNDSVETQIFSMTEPFPMKPNPQVVKKMMIKYVSDKQLEKVKKLFEECPIWNRVALIYESQIGLDKLKCIIPSLAYYFTSGPWKMMYIRYGYDPRKDFQSRFYQTFDYRMRYKTGIAQYVKARSEAIRSKEHQSSTSKDQSLIQNINYPYLEEGQLPRSRQCIFRYCDLRIPKIQEMLKKTPTPLTGAVCNEKTGWLPTAFDMQCRQIIATSLKEYMISLHQQEKDSKMTSSDEEDDGNLSEDMEYYDDDQPDEETKTFDSSAEEQLLFDKVLMDIEGT